MPKSVVCCQNGVTLWVSVGGVPRPNSWVLMLGGHELSRNDSASAQASGKENARVSTGRQVWGRGSDGTAPSDLQAVKWRTGGRSDRTERLSHLHDLISLWQLNGMSTPPPPPCTHTHTHTEGGDLNRSLKPTCSWARQGTPNRKNTNTFRPAEIGIHSWVEFEPYCVDEAALLLKCDQKEAKSGCFGALELTFGRCFPSLGGDNCVCSGSLMQKSNQRHNPL